MGWIPTRCPVCGSDKRSDRSRCDNPEDNGTPCHGLSAEDAALMAAKRAFERDKVTLAEYEALVDAALTDPPQRRFSMMTVLR